ncbi:MAG TPA: sensor histidine kinase [Spirochaetaceae bacterium]|jgi:two-component sensor histidine kinase|nr:sensor histidine kinase [Spirochaetaceae bacterium]
MRRSSPEHSEGSDAEAQRAKIIGLGAGSARKSYYPQLQEKIRDLESKQLTLMDTVRTLEERESELELLVEEKNLLLKEVHHRVKNNFQIIGSLLNLGLGSISSELEAAAFSRTKRRIDTMGMVYGQLLQADRFADVDLCELVTQLVNALYYDAGKPSVELAFDMSCPDLFLDVDRAIPLALIVSEAASNSFDHGFPDGRGRLRVSLKEGAREESGTLYHLVELCDDGPGFDIGGLPPPGSSLGLMLIDLLASQLKALYAFDTPPGGKGTRFSLFFI